MKLVKDEEIMKILGKLVFLTPLFAIFLMLMQLRDIYAYRGYLIFLEVFLLLISIYILMLDVTNTRTNILLEKLIKIIDGKKK